MPARQIFAFRLFSAPVRVSAVLSPAACLQQTRGEGGVECAIVAPRPMAKAAQFRQKRHRIVAAKASMALDALPMEGPWLTDTRGAMRA